MSSRHAILLGLCIFACVPSVKVRLQKQNIDIFLSRENISRPFKEIGTIVIEDDRNQGQQKLLSMAVKQAREMGADGIIMQPAAKKTITYIPMDKADLSLKKRIVRYLAVVYEAATAP